MTDDEKKAPRPRKKAKRAAPSETMPAPTPKAAAKSDTVNVFMLRRHAATYGQRQIVFRASDIYQAEAGSVFARILAEQVSYGNARPATKSDLATSLRGIVKAESCVK